MRRVLPIAAGLSLLAAAPAPVAVPVTVQIGNLRNADGDVHVDLCTRAQFLTDTCSYGATVRTVAGTTTLIVRGVPPGRYAAQAFHDENRNGKVDRVIFGIPKEGVGFSNDVRIRFSAPKFDDAAFSVGSVPLTIRFSMRYFLGPAGPAPR